MAVYYITVNIGEIKWILNQSSATAILQTFISMIFFCLMRSTIVSNKTSKSVVSIVFMLPLNDEPQRKQPVFLFPTGPTVFVPEG
jgi:hypothetical protein